MEKKQYEIQSCFFIDLEDKIIVPKFQRNLVWDFDKKQNLLNTVHNGLPFGTILVYEDKERYYQLIDGLQRFSTLKEYKLNPLKFLLKQSNNELEKFIDDLYQKIDNIYKQYQLQLNIDKQLIQNIIEEEYLNTFKRNNNVTNYSYDLLQKLKNYTSDIYSIDNNFDLLLSEFSKQIANKVIEYIDIDKIQIPVIIYKGDEEFLSELYNIINTQGTRLSEYDIYAALWSNEYLKIDNEKIKNEVIQMYENKYKNEDNEAIYNIAENIHDRIDKKGINCYEFLFVMSKMMEEYPIFTPKDKDKNKIAFQVLSLLFNSSKSKSKKSELPLKLHKLEELCINDFIKFILESTKNINDILIESTSHFKNEDKDGIPSYSNNLLLSIFYVYFNINYIIEEEDGLILIEKNEIDEKINKKFKENIPKWYLYESLRNNWASNNSQQLLYSDIELFNKCNDIYSQKYIRNITTEDWKIVLNTYYQNDKNINSSNISGTNKLFLLYFYNYMHTPQNGVYDIEHIIPKEKLKNTDFYDSISISCIANLCYLPKNTNRSKKNFTIYEANNHNHRLPYSIEDALDLFYPDEKLINFCEANKKFTKEQYNDFLDSRWNLISTNFIKTISKTSL